MAWRAFHRAELLLEYGTSHNKRTRNEMETPQDVKRKTGKSSCGDATGVMKVLYEEVFHPLITSMHLIMGVCNFESMGVVKRTKCRNFVKYSPEEVYLNQEIPQIDSMVYTTLNTPLANTGKGNKTKFPMGSCHFTYLW